VTIENSSINVMAEFGILDAHEVAELLKLRHSTVLDLSRRGILPAFKIGKHWRYRRPDLEEWMVRQRDAAAPDIESVYLMLSTSTPARPPCSRSAHLSERVALKGLRCDSSTITRWRCGADV
jgi:excisionase family DNA binding protein